MEWSILYFAVGAVWSLAYVLMLGSRMAMEYMVDMHGELGGRVVRALRSPAGTVAMVTIQFMLWPLILTIIVFRLFRRTYD